MWETELTGSSLTAHHYTSPAMFQQEQNTLFATTWQYAGHVSELAKPGDYFTFAVAGQDLFCLLDATGKIHTYYNVCQHRAHELVTGKGNASLLVCPYHAWCYELTGELRSGPNIAAIKGIERHKIRLSEVKTEVFHGFIFVNLDPNAAPMDVWFPGVKEELSAFVPFIQQLKPLAWVEINEHCNWKVSVENYSECYHCKFNHLAFTDGIVKPETYAIRPQGYCLRHTTECQNLNKLSYPIAAERPHAMEYSSWFLWPTFSFQVYPGNVLNTYLWRPTGAEQVTVWRGWYIIPETMDTDVIHQLAQQDRNTTVQEDINLVESVQRGMKSRGYQLGPLVIDEAGGVNSELPVHILRQWVYEAIQGNSKGLS